MLSLAVLATNPTVQCVGAVALYLYLVLLRRDAFGRSAVDCVQKRAQAREMDHTNTPPAALALLAAVQLPAVAAASHYLLDDYGQFTAAGVTAIVAHIAGFALSLATGTDMLFDITGELTFGAILCYVYVGIAAPSPRQTLAFGLAGVWVLRLGYFLFARILRRGGRDWRFEKLVKGHAYNAFGWVCQGTWIWLNGFCLWLLAGARDGSGRGAPPMGVVDYLGVAVFLAGFVCEIVADEQKSAWNRRNRFEHDRQTTWIQEGLWKYSRHPNFFGEMLLWLGQALLCIGGLEGTTVRTLAFVSPAWSAFFLIFTSLMLLEKRLDSKFEGDPEYEAYKARTSVLVPMPLRATTPA